MTSQRTNPDWHGTDAPAPTESPSRWSHRLAEALLEALPDTVILELSHQFNSTRIGPSTVDSQPLRTKFMELAAESSELRQSLMRAWRDSRPELLDAVNREMASYGDTTMAGGALRQRFAAQDILLEMITDPDDDGWLIAEEWVAEIHSDRLRAEFAAELRTLASSDPTTEPSGRRLVRVVIFGGHPRDESELAGRIFPNGPFDIRWKASERLGVQVRHVVTSSLNFADGAIVVTSRVSHEVMHAVKRHCQIYELPFQVVVKGTRSQIEQAIQKMFPSAPA